MPRYIDADALIVERTIFMQDEEGFDVSVVLVSDIKLAPTADVEEVKHGRWVKDERSRKIVCSKCGGRKPYRKNDKRQYHIMWDSDYCPSCGANMKGSRNK